MGDGSEDGVVTIADGRNASTSSTNAAELRSKEHLVRDGMAQEESGALRSQVGIVDHLDRRPDQSKSHTLEWRVQLGEVELIPKVIDQLEVCALRDVRRVRELLRHRGTSAIRVLLAQHDDRLRPR